MTNDLPNPFHCAKQLGPQWQRVITIWYNYREKTQHGQAWTNQRSLPVRGSGACEWVLPEQTWRPGDQESSVRPTLWLSMDGSHHQPGTYILGVSGGSHTHKFEFSHLTSVRVFTDVTKIADSGTMVADRDTMEDLKVTQQGELNFALLPVAISRLHRHFVIQTRSISLKLLQMD